MYEENPLCNTTLTPHYPPIHPRKRQEVESELTNERCNCTTPGRQFDFMPEPGFGCGPPTDRQSFVKFSVIIINIIMSSSSRSGSSSYEIRNAKKENTLYTANFDCLAPNPHVSVVASFYASSTATAAPKTKRLSHHPPSTLPVSLCLTVCLSVGRSFVRCLGA